MRIRGFAQKKKDTISPGNSPFNERKVLETLEADLLSVQSYVVEGDRFSETVTEF